MPRRLHAIAVPLFPSRSQSPKNCEKRQNLHQMRLAGNVWPASVLKYRQSNESQPLIHANEGDLRHRCGDEGIRSYPIGGKDWHKSLRAIFERQKRAPAQRARFLSRQARHAGEERTCSAAGKIWLRPTRFIGTAQCATAATPRSRSSGFIYRQGKWKRRTRKCPVCFDRRSNCRSRNVSLLYFAMANKITTQ
jgi:hypothetical protein